MRAYFNRFTLTMTRVQAHDCSHPGYCDNDVEALVSIPTIRRQLNTIPSADIAAELQEYGAWTDEELADHEANRRRIIWIAACNIAEEAAAEIAAMTTTTR